MSEYMYIASRGCKPNEHSMLLHRWVDVGLSSCVNRGEIYLTRDTRNAILVQSAISRAAVV